MVDCASSCRQPAIALQQQQNLDMASNIPSQLSRVAYLLWRQIGDGLFTGEKESGSDLFFFFFQNLLHL
ncbi:hypothetical protein SDJN02_04166, partial [Cucurbita argyrosperma subsp. argyrosperma]